MTRVEYTVGLMLHFLFVIQSVESATKDAKAMNVTNIAFRSFEQSNSSRHIASSRSTVEIDNKVNETLTWENDASCGKITYIPPPPRHARVLGGRDAEHGKWPWMAMIMRYFESSGFTQTCGGTLIRSQWVLTAGHCFFGDPSSYTHVILGAYYKSLKETSVRRFAIAKYICHHLYIGAGNTYEDDACLIKLAGPAQYSDFIRPICLPLGDQRAVANETCKIAGWGVTTFDPFGSPRLQTAEVPIVSKTTCQSWYGESGVILPTHHFCAGYQKGGIDSCQGDSGGPLACDRKPGNAEKVVQFGITSFGLGCGEKERPGVYTDVREYTKWIETKTQENSGPDECFKTSDILDCGTVISKTGTTLRSPVDSTTTWLYPPNSRCSWDIRAPPGHGIKLEFSCFFHVEINAKNFSECYDYIMVSTNTGFKDVYCGTTKPNPIYISANEITLSFYSDGSMQSSGFVTKVLFIAPQSQGKRLNASFSGYIPDERASNRSLQSPVGSEKCDSGNCGSTGSVMRHNTLCISLLMVLVTSSFAS